ncbi:MAG: hypothetical protein PHE45_08770, partial [Bacteroidales bacterium]|nr:hypothetical protein [Bacteroidales bacterium]
GSAVVVVILFTIMSLVISQLVYSQESELLSEKAILSMDSEELLNVLQTRGLHLPTDYAENRDMAQHFVSEYVPLLIQGKINPNVDLFNYDKSNQMLRNLAGVLEEMQFPIVNYSTRYTLQNSTAIGSWSDSYLYYNCYAYSLGRTSGLQPGSISDTPFSMTLSISEMADVVLEDLDVMGYWGYKTTRKPIHLPDQWFRVICIRKDTSNVDYHFMKTYGSLYSWAHKPGGTQPLSWNYSSPGFTVWSNERVAMGIVYAPTVTYESAIYYILYKGKNDPGIQPRSVEE